MRTYRKRPVEVQAKQWDGTVEGATEVIDWVLENDGTARFISELHCVAIDTLEGTMRALGGDYVIRGVKGEFYPCRSDIFEATYDEVAACPARVAIDGETHACDRTGDHTIHGSVDSGAIWSVEG